MSMGLNPFENLWFPNFETTRESIIYNSSIDDINNLYAGVAYFNNNQQKPICVLMHGWNGAAIDYHPSKTVEFADYGFFSIAVGMRGRDGASGFHDANGRELYDIIDAIEYVKKHYPNEVDSNNIVVAGYSGGGGNNFGLAAKFPDYFNAHLVHFGLSDVGYNDIYSWWITHPSRRSQIERRVGGTREEQGKYYSRSHQYGAAKNYLQGFMFIYHDREDSVVGWQQSQMVADQFGYLNRTNWSLNITESSDYPRWLHQQPDVGSEVIYTRDEWGPLVLNKALPEWIVPEQGEMLIQGYLITKRFEIWLGNGQEHVAELDYDVNNDKYIINPLTGEVTVSIAQGDKTVSETISSETTIVVN